MKGLIYGTDIPVCGISTLQAAAGRVTDFDGVVCSLLDAGKNEAYSALFHIHGNHFERLTEDEIVPVLRVFERLCSSVSHVYLSATEYLSIVL